MNRIYIYSEIEPSIHASDVQQPRKIGWLASIVKNAAAEPEVFFVRYMDLHGLHDLHATSIN